MLYFTFYLYCLEDRGSAKKMMLPLMHLILWKSGDIIFADPVFQDRHRRQQIYPIVNLKKVGLMSTTSQLL